jgi:hypothetical protein
MKVVVPVLAEQGGLPYAVLVFAMVTTVEPAPEDLAGHVAKGVALQIPKASQFSEMEHP